MLLVCPPKRNARHRADNLGRTNYGKVHEDELFGDVVGNPLTGAWQRLVVDHRLLGGPLVDDRSRPPHNMWHVPMVVDKMPVGDDAVRHLYLMPTAKRTLAVATVVFLSLIVHEMACFFEQPSSRRDPCAPHRICTSQNCCCGRGSSCRAALPRLREVVSSVRFPSSPWSWFGSPTCLR
jgi:hypothetical protein